MSQTSKTLKKIASGEEYQALVAAVEQADYEAIFNTYTQITRLLEEAQKEIEERIQNLPRHNKDEDCQKFRSAFASRCRTTLPQWYLIDSELKKQNIMEGEVLGLGSKGDPLARTPQGRVVVIRGGNLKEGDKVKFKVISEGGKVDFGSVFELSPHTFYLILNQDTRDRIRDSFASLREYINNSSDGTDEDRLSQLSQLLKQLEEVRELASKLREEDREKTLARVVAHRRRLLTDAVMKLAFDFLAQQEEKDIEDCCQSEQQAASALSAPGIFRQRTYEAVKAELLSREKPKAYQETLDKLENNMDSMNSALEFLDFKAEIDKLYPTAKKYLQRMDQLFQRLSQKAIQVAFELGEDKLYDMSDIRSAIENAFSGKALYSELRRAFRSPEEFFSLRVAFGELRARLGNRENSEAEMALKPYLSQVIASALGDGHRIMAGKRPAAE